MPASGSPVRSSYTLAEILSQPEIWRSSLQELGKNPGFQGALNRASSRREWLFVGCGSCLFVWPRRVPQHAMVFLHSKDSRELLLLKSRDGAIASSLS